MRSPQGKAGAVIEWLEFAHPEKDDYMFRVNVSLMLSGYQCIYGSGCPSIKADLPREDVGCCAQGVTFEDEDDFKHVEKMVGELTEADCANLDHVRNKGWYIRTPKGEPRNTRKLGNKCIFANPAPTKPGDPQMGCSFHALADRTGRHHSDTKPVICWSVPIYSNLDYDDGNDVDVFTVTNVTANTWGARDPEPEDGDEGRGYFTYWCMDTPDAFVGSVPFYIDNEVELRKIMGDPGYERMAELLKDKVRQHPMPGELVNDGKPMIADIISLQQQLREKTGKRAPL